MGACANYICTTHGCQGHCGYQVPRQGYWTGMLGAPRGCICPPTSEQTCQSQACPRKTLPLASEVKQP